MAGLTTSATLSELITKRFGKGKYKVMGKGKSYTRRKKKKKKWESLHLWSLGIG